MSIGLSGKRKVRAAHRPNERAGGKGGITSSFHAARSRSAPPQHERWGIEL